MTIPTGTNLLSALPLTTNASGDGLMNGNISVLSADPDVSALASTEKAFWSMLNQQLSELTLEEGVQVADVNELLLSMEMPANVLEVNPELAFSLSELVKKLDIPIDIDMDMELPMAMTVEPGMDPVMDGDSDPDRGMAEEWMQGLMPFFPASDYLQELTPGDEETLSEENELLSAEYVIPAFSNVSENSGDRLPVQRQASSVNLSRVNSSGAVDVSVRPLTLDANQEQVLADNTDLQVNSPDKKGAESALDQPFLKSENFKQVAGELNLPVTKESAISPQGSQLSSIATPQPAQPHAPPLNQPVADLQLSARQSPSQWGEALGEKVSLLLNQQLNRAEIRIDPPHLGKLDIQVQVKDDVATVVIHTQHAQTRDMIDSASMRLREFLQEAGYSAVNVDVSQREQSARQDDLSGQQGSREQNDSAQASSQDKDAQDWQSSRVSVRINDGRIDYFA